MADINLRQPGIYAIRNTVNGKLYVGSAVSVARRWQVHRSNLKTGVHRCKPLQRAYDKYGADAFIYEVLEFVTELTALVVREQHYLDTLDSHCERGGYNVCPVAESRLGMKMPESAKRAIGLASRGRRITQEQKDAVSLVHKGKTISEAHRAAVSAAHKGRKHSPEHVAKIAAASRGRKLSEAQKARVSAVHKGKTISQAQKDAIGKAARERKRSPEEIAKLKASLTGRVISAQHRLNISIAKRKAFSGKVVGQLSFL
jgi:group I intron endonuclease